MSSGELELSEPVIPLPGHAISIIPDFNSKLGAFSSLIARCHIRRGRIAFIFSAGMVSFAAVSTWPHWTELRLKAQSTPIVVMSAPAAEEDVSDEQSAEFDTLLARTGELLAEAKELAEGPDDPAALLAEKRAAISRELAAEGNLAEARNVTETISGIIAEMRTRKVNNSPLSVLPEPKQEPARPDDALAKLEALERIVEKAEAVSEMLARPAPPILNDKTSELEIRIADGEDVTSGFWRTAGDEDQYFLVVEAASKDGMPYAWKVTDADTGEISRAARWAVSVSEEDFARLSSEKAVNGRLSDTLAGVKRAGSEEIEWKVSTDGKALVEWSEDDQ